jgi:DNA-binding response OmpR family regulator
VSDVTIVRWPEEAAVAAYLRAAGRPRLLLVAPHAQAPVTTDWDEDWVRLPATDDDVRVRAAALEARAARRLRRPELGADGRLFAAGHWVALSHVESEMVRVMCDRFGEVVDADALAVGADRRRTPTAVRVHLTRLRKRIRPIGLVIHTVRGRGYVLDYAPAADVGT